MVIREFLTIFSHTGQQILTHLIVRIEENLRPHLSERLVWYTLQRPYLVRLAIFLLFCYAINGLEYLLNQQPVSVKHRVQHRQPLGVGKRDALIQTR